MSMTRKNFQSIAEAIARAAVELSWELENSDEVSADRIAATITESIIPAMYEGNRAFNRSKFESAISTELEGR